MTPQKAVEIRPFKLHLCLYFQGDIVKQIIAAVFLTVTSVAAMGQTFDPASIAQKQRQQANAGAKAAQAAHDKGGLAGVAELSATCFNDAQTGARASDYCLGIEAVGVSTRDKSPDADASAKSWFNHPQMTNRVLTHCIQYLGLRDEMACAQRLAVARAAIPDRSQAPAPTAPVAKPSFDCKRASHRVEHMICSSEKLSRLDALLASTYKSRLEPVFQADKNYMRTQQTAWLSQRNRCQSEGCIQEAYEVRVSDLCDMAVPSGVKPTHECDSFSD